MNIIITQLDKISFSENVVNYKKLYINESENRKIAETRLAEKIAEIKELKKIIAEQNKLENPKGSQCSISGNNYEKQIYNVVKNCNINDKPFNTQNVENLGRSSCQNDMNCNFKNIEDIGIEIKKHNTPDWMQCSIKYDINSNKWKISKGKNPKECGEIFMELISNLWLYDGDIPPFIINPITYDEWIQIKNKTKPINGMINTSIYLLILSGDYINQKDVIIFR